MMRPAAWLMALNGSIDEVVDYRALALLRIAAGPLVLLHLAPFRQSADEGIAYSDVFYEPYVAWFPDISRGGYFLLLNAAAVAALLLTLGLFTRISAPATAALVGYNLFLSQTHFHHNRAFLLLLLVGLALTPCGGALSLDARFGRHANTRARRWPLMLLRFELAVVYAPSGLSKLLDPDWWSGLVNQIRLERYAQVVLDRGVPDGVVDLLLTPGFHAVTAKAIVLTELFIGFGLLWRRTRIAAIWVAIPFHIAIEISAEVQVFSYAALAALVVWATPGQRDREVALRLETSPIRALALAADLADISVNQLYQLNPAFNRWATAPNGPHRLLLPRDKAEQFKIEVAKVPPSKRINWVRHKIRNGETLSHISKKYRTTVGLIKKVNNIRGNQIRAGKHLMVPTATKSLQTYTLSENSRKSAIQNTNRPGNKRVHVVRSGQSLWSISRHYGVTTRSLAKWNGIAPIDTLSVGQKLVVWTRAEVPQTVSINQTRPSNALHKLRYTVRKGDSLYLIANRFNIRVADIKRWNRVGKYLHPGQKLKLYVDITSQSG